MSRFGRHDFAAGWEALPSGARPLIVGDAPRLGVALAAIAATASFPTAWLWPWLVLAAIVPVLVLTCARVPARFTLNRLIPMLPLILASVILLPWLADGERVQVAGLSLSRDGLGLAAAVFLKSQAALLWLSWLLATTPVPRLFKALRTLHLPGPLVEILETTARFLTDLARETNRMLLAARARSWTPRRKRSIRDASSRLGSLLGALFIRTLKRSERCTAARQARDFASDSNQGSSNPPQPDSPLATSEGLIIRFDRLSYAYPDSASPALNHLSLGVERGSKTALLGVNGAGKTTLLLHLNGVLAPQSGSLEVDGIVADPDTQLQLRRHVGMVFQDPDDQVIGTTVFEDVCYGLRQLDLDETTIEARAMEALSAVGLRERRDRPPFTLSPGERKRAAIAGVLAVRPQILVFDEPMASLDPTGKDEIAVLLQDLHIEGHTILVATHDVDFAASWADQVVLLDRGQVLAAGSPDLLVDEAAISAAGLALPIASRPFQQLRPHVKSGPLAEDLSPLPRNAQLAYAWLKRHLLEKPRQTKPASPNALANEERTDRPESVK